MVDLPVWCVSARPVGLTGPETPIPATIEEQQRWDAHVRQAAATATPTVTSDSLGEDIASVAPVAATFVIATKHAVNMLAGGAVAEALHPIDSENKQGSVGQEVEGDRGSETVMKASALFYDPFAAKRARDRLDATSKPMVLTQTDTT